MQLFYQPTLRQTDQQIWFPKQESKHIVKVLRKKMGDKIQVTNGKGTLFTAEITEANSSQCLASILKTQTKKKRPYSLHLAVAPTKKNDRFEWFLEKATEIGIDKITPLICTRSERKKIKLERYERVLQSAMKQSLHYRLPILEAPVDFSDFIQQKHKGQCFIAHCEKTDKKSLKNGIMPQQEYTVLIGPEGDFSSEEISAALKQKFIPISMGNNRLRTETAAIVACHTVALCNE